jgi:hypothetical protein
MSLADYAEGDVRRNLERVCQEAVTTLCLNGAGLTLMHRGQHFGVLASDGSHVGVAEELERRTDQGPALDAFRTRAPVHEPHLGQCGLRRWPVYATAAADQPLSTVVAAPIPVGEQVVGTVLAVSKEAVEMDARELGFVASLGGWAGQIIATELRRAPTVMAGIIHAAGCHAANFARAAGMLSAARGRSLRWARDHIRREATHHRRTLDDMVEDVLTRGRLLG